MFSFDMICEVAKLVHVSQESRRLGQPPADLCVPDSLPTCIGRVQKTSTNIHSAASKRQKCLCSGRNIKRRRYNCFGFLCWRSPRRQGLQQPSDPLRQFFVVQSWRERYSVRFFLLLFHLVAEWLFYSTAAQNAVQLYHQDIVWYCR